MLRTALLVAAACLGPCLAAAQPPADSPPTGTGLVLGRVIEAATDRPVAGAVIVLGGTPGMPVQRALADRDGRFVFRNVPKGTYTLVATRTGYMAGAYGRRHPAGVMQPLDLDDGERVADVVIPVWKAGSISGTVTDEAGEPVVGITVNVYRRGTMYGRRALTSLPTDITDDRGAFRFWNLTPGDYIVGIQTTTTLVPQSVADAYTATMLTANPGASDPARDALIRQLFNAQATALAGGNAVRVGEFTQPLGRGPVAPPAAGLGRMFVYPTQFYPAAPSAAEATTIRLASGQDRAGIDLQIRPAPAARITGTIVGPDGPAPQVGLVLIPGLPDDLQVAELQTATTISDASGAFTFAGVPPGQYSIRAVVMPVAPRSGPVTTSMIQVGSGMVMSTMTNEGAPGQPLPPTGPTLWTVTPVTVGERDITDFPITLRTGLKVSGRIEFEGSADRPTPDQLQRISVSLQSPGGRRPAVLFSPMARTDATGQFATAGLPGGRYLARAQGAPPGWTFKSAMHDGKDLADVPLDLTAEVGDVVVTFTDRPSELSGTVTGGDGAPDADATVVVFPADRGTWAGWPVRRFRSVRSTRAGVYKLPDLPAGDYLAVALAPDSASDWETPAALEVLAAHATRVTVVDGQRQSLNLRTAQIAR